MVVVLEASSPSSSLCLAEAVATCAAPWSLRGGVGMRPDYTSERGVLVGPLRIRQCNAATRV